MDPDPQSLREQHGSITLVYSLYQVFWYQPIIQFKTAILTLIRFPLLRYKQSLLKDFK